MHTGHITGCALLFMCQIAFLIQRIEDDYFCVALPIVMLIITVPFFVLFFRFNPKENQSDDPKVVSRNSYKVLLYESIALAMCAFSICFYYLFLDLDA